MFYVCNMIAMFTHSHDIYEQDTQGVCWEMAGGDQGIAFAWCIERGDYFPLTQRSLPDSQS